MKVGVGHAARNCCDGHSPASFGTSALGREELSSFRKYGSQELLMELANGRVKECAFGKAGELKSTIVSQFESSGLRVERTSEDRACRCS